MVKRTCHVVPKALILTDGQSMLLLSREPLIAISVCAEPRVNRAYHTVTSVVSDRGSQPCPASARHRFVLVPGSAKQRMWFVQRVPGTASCLCQARPGRECGLCSEAMIPSPDCGSSIRVIQCISVRHRFTTNLMYL